MPQGRGPSKRLRSLVHPESQYHRKPQVKNRRIISRDQSSDGAVVVDFLFKKKFTAEVKHKNAAGSAPKRHTAEFRGQNDRGFLWVS
jgi:hypothetical protein